MPTAMIAAFIWLSAKHNYPISNYNTAMLTHNPLTHKTRPNTLFTNRVKSNGL
jgi:hypothetical protein